MKVVNTTQWGFLLGHENITIFLPFKANGFFMQQHQVMLGDSRGFLIRTGDRAFYIDNDHYGVHIIKSDHELVNQIKECVVAFVRSHR